MNIQDISRHLRRLVEANAPRASYVVANEIRDQILVNTKSARGFGSDPYKRDLARATQELKKRKGTYAGTHKSTLRDEDHSITRLRVSAPKKNVSVIDFRSTGKGELFYAHHYGEPAPKPWKPHPAQRSIIPLKETSVPMHIHELAARSILVSNGLPNIIIKTNQAVSRNDDWRSEVPF